MLSILLNQMSKNGFRSGFAAHNHIWFVITIQNFFDFGLNLPRYYGYISLSA